MATIPGLQLRQTHNLLMTQQLRLAIRILQMTGTELGTLVEEELQANPFLTLAGNDDPAPAETPDAEQEATTPDVESALDISVLDEASGRGFDDTYSEDGSPQDWRTRHVTGTAGTGDAENAASPTDSSLAERLDEQLRLTTRLTVSQRFIGRALIGSLDPSGRLACPPEEIATELSVTVDAVEDVRQIMLTFDPPGLFALSLRECLAAQLAAADRLTPAMNLLLDNLDLVASRHYAALRALCDVEERDFAAMLAELRRLDPKPGFEDTPLAGITRVPDVIVQRAADGEWIVRANEDTLPRLQIDTGLRARTRRLGDTADRAFVQTHMAHASWLIRAMEQRTHTLLRVTSEIMRHQKGFLDHGVSALRPLTMKIIAETTGLHESTISRVTSGKYVVTPRGLHELKYFFTTAVGGQDRSEHHSSEAIRYRIRYLIADEKDSATLSDDDIVRQLRNEGIDIARRTVAKYRDSLHIPNSVQRKREKAASA
ncbi:RNA polymerase factor sigma-54 [Acetobacter conturbans]|uniref:RNA polymerase sigma-54 factor n=1 Tax=Acetobacter conturbans TaxID=1737472 RepID=A0ABX0K1E9_9PROT|nr:RNA polymerase factor sigma-54 [Acetobacter conturbans]NHN88939.1 RNA polymerase factor sigma-54 [Acetobacter conturbans]